MSKPTIRRFEFETAASYDDLACTDLLVQVMERFIEHQTPETTHAIAGYFFQRYGPRERALRQAAIDTP